MRAKRKRLQDLPYHIQERVWRSVCDDLDPQVLFLEVDGLRNVLAKPFRDMASDAYKFLALEGTLGHEVPLSDMGATRSSLCRKQLRQSTSLVRGYGSLCSNSRRAITKAFPDVLGLRFMHCLNRKKDVGRKGGVLDDSHLRFNGDTDLFIMSGAQWERQIYFIRNQHSIKGALKYVRNLGLDLGTLWNDRLLQKLDSSFPTPPEEILREEPRRVYKARRMDPHDFRGDPDTARENPPIDGGETQDEGVARQNHAGYLNILRSLPDVAKRFEWRVACGCWTPHSQNEDADWISDGGPPEMPPCRRICRREPLPEFMNALPNVRTLVLVAMDNPIICPGNVVRAHRKLFSSRHNVKHATIIAGQDRYSPRYSITDSGYRARGQSVTPPTLERIQSEWRRGFPYESRMPNVKVKYMRPVKNSRRWPGTEDPPHPFHSSDTDIPYVYEIQQPAQTPSRKRSRHSSGSDGHGKRQKIHDSWTSSRLLSGMDGGVTSPRRSGGRGRRRRKNRRRRSRD